jgi:hypothetical protein
MCLFLFLYSSWERDGKKVVSYVNYVLKRAYIWITEAG